MDDELHRLLKLTIAADHERIERLPIARRMADGSVSGADYGGLLHALAPVHVELERRLDADAQLDGLFAAPLVRRSAALARDLTILPVPPRHGPAGRAAAQRLATWLAGCTRGEAAGAAYVVAGSCLGAAVIAPRLAQALAVPAEPGHGLDYQLVPPAVLVPAWRATLAALTAFVRQGGADRAAVALGAGTMMAGLHTVYAECPA